MIKPYHHSGTEDAPEIIFEPENNIFKISGRSLKECPKDFYAPVLEWIKSYVKQPNDLTHLICDIEYFNSTSAKKIYDIFYEFIKIKDKGKEIKITWYYEPGDSFTEKKGREFDSVIDIPFEIITSQK